MFRTSALVIAALLATTQAVRLESMVLKGSSGEGGEKPTQEEMEAKWDSMTPEEQEEAEAKMEESAGEKPESDGEKPAKEETAALAQDDEKTKPT